MKKSLNLMYILGFMSLTYAASAQYDDVYYDGTNSVKPRTRTLKSDRTYADQYAPSSESVSAYTEDDDTYAGGTYDNYDDQAYNYLDEYDYSYTHRIRRFQRPIVGRGFYDPYYWDPWFYDPYYYSSGFGFNSSIINIGFYSFNDYNRWNRWNRFNRFRYWDPWTYGYWASPYSFNTINNYYWAGSGYCPSSWYSNNFFYGNSYWGNSYNSVYQPRFYTDQNVHFGPRTYGATTTSDRGPSRSSSRILSEPGDPGRTPALTRTSPRDAGVTTVRERNIPINRTTTEPSTNGASERMSPRPADRVTERNATQSSGNERVRTYRDYEDKSPATVSPRSTPRYNDDSRLRGQEQSPRSNRENDYNPGSIRREAPGYDAPRNERVPRNESPRFEAPRRETQRFETPRNESPRFEAPRQETPRYNPPSRQESPRYESPRSYSPPRNDGGNAPSNSGNNSGGGVRSSPRNQ